MKINLDKYNFVVTSANDKDCLTLECTDDSAVATITQHVADLPLELVEDFVKKVRTEIQQGGELTH